MARRKKQPDTNGTTGEAAAEKPKRKRGGAIVAPGGNVTDDTIREFYAKAEAAKVELETAEKDAAAKRGAYRAVLKAAKSAGIPREIIAWRLEQRARDVKDIDRETTWKNRVAKLTGLPIGTQLGLFQDGGTVAAAVDAEQAAMGGTFPTPQALADAEEDGERAGSLGKSADQSPFTDPAHPLAIRWEKGRQKSQEAMARKFGPSEAPEMAGRRGDPGA